MTSIILMSMKKALKNASIYKQYEHFQSCGFTFKRPTKKETYNVKLKEKMNLIEPTYKCDRFGFDFWAFYRDKNIFFIYENRSPTGYIEDYNGFFLKQKMSNTLDKKLSTFYSGDIGYRDRGANITCYVDLKNLIKIPNNKVELLKKDIQILV